MTWRLVRLGLAGWRSRLVANALAFALLAIAAGSVMLGLQLRAVADHPYERTFEATNGAHVLGISPNAGIAGLADVDGVIEASPIAPAVVTTLTTRDTQYALEVIGLDTPPSVERPVVTSGRWVATDDEVVLERSYAELVGIEVGQQVQLRRTDGSATVTVVGIAVAANAEGYPESQPGQGFARVATVEAIAPEGASLWYQAVRIDDPSRTHEVVRAAAEAIGVDAGFVTWQSRFADASERTRTTTIVLRSLGVVLLLAVALVIVTLVGARVVDRAAELGLLKAVGFTPAQVSMLIGVELLVVAGAASIVGAVAGSLLAPRLVRMSAELLGTPPTSVSPARVLVTVVVVLLLVAAAAVVPTLRLARAGVLRSLDAERAAGRVNRLARRIPLRSPLALTTSTKQAIARPGRSVATATALAITVGALVAALAFEATVRNEDRAEASDQLAVISHQQLEPLAPLRPDPVPVVDATREQIQPIVRGFNLVLVAVAVANLLASSLLVLRQRRREIALVRAMGFTPQQVRRTVYCSDGLVGLAASLVGLPLGIALFLGVYRVVNGDTELATLPPAWQLVLLPVACVAAILAVVAVPARRATVQSVTTALQHE